MGRSWATQGAACLVLALVLAAGACSDGGSEEETSAAGERTTTTVPAADPSPTSSPSATGGPTVDSTVAPAGSTTRPPPTSASTATSLGGPGLPPSTPPSQPVVTASGGGSVATGLSALPGCDAGRALVRLSWRPSGANEQVVAVSARKDGLDTGNYTTSEVLAPDRSTYSLRDSQPGGIYYWRVLTRRDGGWAASATAQFEGPTCVPF